MRVSKWLALAIVLSACGGGHVLRVDEPVSLGAQDGALAFPVECQRTVSLITLCPTGDMTRCVDVGPVAPPGAFHAVHLGAGRWCVLRLGVEATIASGAVHEVEEHEAECFDVHPGVVSYAGDFVVRISDTDSSALRLDYGWRVRTDAVRDTIATQYPHLARYPLRPTGVAAR